MAVRALQQFNNETSPLEKSVSKYESYISGSLEVLDLDFNRIFVPVEDLNESDVDDQGNLILERFLNEELLAQEGIPLSYEEIIGIFSGRSVATCQESLKAG